MVYKAIVDFKDLMTGHDYKAGDVYPFEGEADKDRVERLIKPTAQRGSLIAEAEEVEEPEPEEPQPDPEEDKAQTKMDRWFT